MTKRERNYMLKFRVFRPLVVCASMLITLMPTTAHAAERTTQQRIKSSSVPTASTTSAQPKHETSKKHTSAAAKTTSGAETPAAAKLPLAPTSTASTTRVLSLTHKIPAPTARTVRQPDMHAPLSSTYNLVRLHEIAPASASGQAWVSLVSLDAGNAIALAGYSLYDDRGRISSLPEGVLDPTVQRSITFALPASAFNRNGGSLSLYDPQGRLIDTMQYGKTSDGEGWVRDTYGAGNWQKVAFEAAPAPVDQTATRLIATASDKSRDDPARLFVAGLEDDVASDITLERAVETERMSADATDQLLNRLLALLITKLETRSVPTLPALVTTSVSTTAKESPAAHVAIQRKDTPMRSQRTQRSTHKLVKSKAKQTNATTAQMRNTNETAPRRQNKGKTAHKNTVAPKRPTTRHGQSDTTSGKTGKRDRAKHNQTRTTQPDKTLAAHGQALADQPRPVTQKVTDTSHPLVTLEVSARTATPNRLASSPSSNPFAMLTQDFSAPRRVRLVGRVSSVPGLLSRHSFVLHAPDGRGVLVTVPTQKRLPQFQSNINVAGSLWLDDKGGPTLKLSSRDGWSHLPTSTQPITPRVVDLITPAGEDAWSMVSVTGTVTNVTGSSIHLDLDDAEIDVTMKPVVKYRTKRLIPGDVVSVTGLLDTTRDVPRILPRLSNELVLIKRAAPKVQTTIAAIQSPGTTLPSWAPLGAAAGVVGVTEAVKHLHQKRKLKKLERVSKYTRQIER